MNDAANGNTLHYRVGELEKDVAELRQHVDRLMWSAFSLLLGVTGSAILLAITKPFG